MIYAVSYTCINALGPSTCDGQINYLGLSIRHDATDATTYEESVRRITGSEVERELGSLSVLLGKSALSVYPESAAGTDYESRDSRSKRERKTVSMTLGMLG